MFQHISNNSYVILVSVILYKPGYYWIEIEFTYNQVELIAVSRVLFDFNQNENQQLSLISFSNSF